MKSGDWKEIKLKILMLRGRRMSNFVHWAIMHGIPYTQGKLHKYALIARRNEIDKMLEEWQKAIIWC